MGQLAERHDGGEVRHYLDGNPIYSGDVIELEIENGEWVLARYERRKCKDSGNLNSVFWVVDQDYGIQVEIETERPCRWLEDK